MDEGSLYELAESIRSQGIMQPILVRPIGEGRYEIIAGERRSRAARLAGLSEVPVLIREVPDEAAAVMALIENIQREDLNPLEEAQGLQRLTQEFGLTHEQAAQAVGRSRSAASNLLRLLNLAIRAGHADGGRHRHGPCPCFVVARQGPADHHRARGGGQSSMCARLKSWWPRCKARAVKRLCCASSKRSRVMWCAWKKSCRTC